MTSWHHLVGALAAVSVVALPAGTQTSNTPNTAYTIDPEQSTLRISVGKSGMFSAFGHDHVVDATRVSGTVNYDARDLGRDAVTFVVKTASLKVTDPGESAADREKVQATMLGPTVLDAEKFPEITFTSTVVAAATGPKADKDGLDLGGVLRLHGVEHALHVPAHLQTEGASLRVRGEATIRQTEYGMTPVTAVGGTVKVKDQVKITFDIVAVPAADGRRQ